MLKHRIITALILIVVLIAFLFIAPPWLFFLALIGILLLAGSEWSALMHLSDKKKWFFVSTLEIIFIALYFLPITWVLSIAVLFWLLAIYWLKGFQKATMANTQPLLWNYPICQSIFAGFVLIPFLLAMFHLFQLTQGALWIVIFIAIIASFDTGAYFIGSRFGKHKLASAISSGKTIEGTLAGFASSLFVALIIAFLFSSLLPHLLGWLIVAILSAAFSGVGDLFESAMKRHAGVKDSGTLLPGHGGILDRIDGYTAAAPFFYLGLIFLGIH